MTQRKDLIVESDASKSRRIFGEGRVALGLIVGLSISLIAFLAYQQLQLGVAQDTLFEALPSIGVLVVALGSLLISYLVLSENRLLRQAGTDPVVLVHLGKRRDAPMLITIDIRNVGAGAALEVAIEVLNGAPNKTHHRVLTDLTQLTHPIRVIPQNHLVSYNFGTGYQLLGGGESEPLSPITLRVSYKDIEGSEYSNEQVLDVRELRSQHAHTPNDTKVAKSLEDIAKLLTRIVDASGHLNVVAQSKHEYLEDREKLFDELKNKGE